jgi:hypothetical protein
MSVLYSKKGTQETKVIKEIGQDKKIICLQSCKKEKKTFRVTVFFGEMSLWWNQPLGISI